MISYCLVSGVFTPRVRILRRGRSYILGRGAKADLQLPADIVSRCHAELMWAPQGGFRLHDRSTNGTLVNDMALAEVRMLVDGDRITIGPFTLQYREYQGDVATLLEEGEHDATAPLSREAVLAASDEDHPGFAGRFAGHELLEIVKLIATGEKNGTLTVQSDDVSGQLGFAQGEIRHAKSVGTANPVTILGEAAALALLSARYGRFEFTAGQAPIQESCRIKTEGFALEVARRLDESSPKGTSEATPTRVLGVDPTAIVADGDLTRPPESWTRGPRPG